MYNFICEKFIKNYQHSEDPKVREKYGIVFSAFSIVCNLISVIIKLIISFITNSVSIRADAFNNLSDIGSNLATLFGFALSNKHSNSDHPYGYGRMEYISGMIVSFLILLMGFESLTDSIDKLIHKSEFSFAYSALIVLIVSICIKFVMYYMNGKAAKAINSETLKAASSDSLNDMLVTGGSVVSLLLFKFFNINIDAIVGIFVAILVLKAGFEVFLGVMNTILGQAPDKELINEISDFITSDKDVIGIHDLIMHDYGPSHKFMTLHAEVDASKDVMKLHDSIDNIEFSILEKYGILTTIHMDPVDLKDELVNELKVRVKDIVLGINANYNIHDFRIVRGDTHTNLVFDVLVPNEDNISHEELKKLIGNKIKEDIGSNYYSVINIDHPFV